MPTEEYFLRQAEVTAHVQSLGVCPGRTPLMGRNAMLQMILIMAILGVAVTGFFVVLFESIARSERQRRRY
ncbi:hypothetical protein ACFQX9_29675 [Bradyrhizobium sp. GCM10028915]|uniref:hypothetical protein n=1 Tax=Bradyrhizobium sp. GCM10028915 TaxID=3273385 RepID=UPI003605B4D5